MRHAQHPLWLGLVGLVSLVGLAGCSSSSGEVSTDFMCPDDLVPAANAEFCQPLAATPDCSIVTPVYKNQVCGVPVKEPPAELARSSGVEKYAGSGPPDLSCFLPGKYPAPPGKPQAVTMTGVAEIFSHGCQSKDLTIEVWTVKRTGGADDGEPNALVGSPVTTASDCQPTGVASEEEMCGTRYECSYAYAGVPTETELLIKTDGAIWAPLYEYNVFIRNEDVSGGMWTHDVRALADDDYGVLSQVALGAPITAQHGAIAGEIHDCGDVRLVNAVVDVDVSKALTTYFTNNEAHPLPERSAKGTSTLGLYSSMDLAPGPVTIGAAGLVGGQVVTAGFFRARVFEDSVTSVTFRGLSPFVTPTP
jgi:hypothetical protein